MVIDEENVISFAPNKDKKRSQSPAKISQSPATNFRPLDFVFRCTHEFTELQRTGSPNSLFFLTLFTHTTLPKSLILAIRRTLVSQELEK